MLIQGNEYTHQRLPFKKNGWLINGTIPFSMFTLGGLSFENG